MTEVFSALRALLVPPPGRSRESVSNRRVRSASLETKWRVWDVAETQDGTGYRNSVMTRGRLGQAFRRLRGCSRVTAAATDVRDPSGVGMAVRRFSGGLRPPATFRDPFGVGSRPTFRGRMPQWLMKGTKGTRS